jgi:hypothetical protein
MGLPTIRKLGIKKMVYPIEKKCDLVTGGKVSTDQANNIDLGGENEHRRSHRVQSPSPVGRFIAEERTQKQADGTIGEARREGRRQGRFARWS